MIKASLKVQSWAATIWLHFLCRLFCSLNPMLYTSVELWTRFFQNDSRKSDTTRHQDFFCTKTRFLKEGQNEKLLEHVDMIELLAQYFCKRSRSPFRLKRYWSCISASSSKIIRHIMCHIIFEEKADIQDLYPLSLNQDRDRLQKYWAIINIISLFSVKLVL